MQSQPARLRGCSTMSNFAKSARVALGLIFAAEGVGAVSRFNARTDAFRLAAQKAKLLGRKLVVVGNPDGGMQTRLLRAYGCGDVCVDIVGCSACPDSVTADITQGPIAAIPNDTAVVFVSCVFEYVSDPFAAWNEVVRMAGTADNVFMVNVQPWTLTSVFYPGARWAIHGQPPKAPGLEAVPMRTVKKAAYVAGLVGLGYLASRKKRPELQAELPAPAGGRGRESLIESWWK